MSSNLNKIDNDWNKYREYFPERYWMPGEADKIFKKSLEGAKINKENLLDVGGGEYGTESLDGMFENHYILDPNIVEFKNKKLKPYGWFILKNSKLLQSLQFDAIVARGSINYLTRHEIISLKAALKQNGIMLFNTFLTPPPITWTKKSYTHKEMFIEEYARFNFSKNKVEHRLIFNGNKIEHTFHYYPEWFFKEVFGPDLVVHRYGANSVTYEYVKNNFK